MAFLAKLSNLFFKKVTQQAKEIAMAIAVETKIDQLSEVKERLLEAVRDHPISQELSSKSTPSQFIESESGTATLFGYLGFEASRQPVEELIEFLDKTVVLEESSKRKFLFFGKKVIVSLRLPSKSDMSGSSLCKVPWSSTAWPVLVENGVSGLSGASHFLQVSSPKSLSGLGIQVKGVTRPDMHPVPFLSLIFKKFKEDLA